MNKLIFTISLLLLHFSSCELLDLTFKEVSYTIDSQERYTYVTQLLVGQIDDHFESISRSTFDIPSTAEIDRFLVKNIYIDVNQGEFNECSVLFIGYTIEVGNGNFVSEVLLDIPDGPIESFFLNNNFTGTLPELRQAIQNAVIHNTPINLFLSTRCSSAAHVDVVITVTLEIVAEYTNCEELPSDLDLPDC